MKSPRIIRVHHGEASLDMTLSDVDTPDLTHIYNTLIAAAHAAGFRVTQAVTTTAVDETEHKPVVSYVLPVEKLSDPSRKKDV